MLDFIINMVVFILSLAFLIVIHEFGHYITSKIFNVYVSEFSIGFGPSLFTRKKENSETRFSIRAIPLGGYCAIVGEALPEFTEEEYQQLSPKDKELVDLYKTVPENRRLDGVKRWKRSIILVAGVTLNFILGFLLLVVSNASRDIMVLNNSVTIIDNSLVHNAGWNSDDVIKTMNYVINVDGKDVYSNTIDYKQDEENFLYKAFLASLSHNYAPSSEADYIKYTLVTTEDKNITFNLNASNKNDKVMWGLSLEKIGIKTHTGKYTFQELMSNSGQETVKFSLTIFETLGKLFTKEGVQNVGGLISIFTVQQQQMEQGFAAVIRLWALISINLAIMNLLPFPGLDGWHLLVILVESITRKDVSKKFKNIMSNIGLILLLGLTLLITIKDIVGLF